MDIIQQKLSKASIVCLTIALLCSCGTGKKQKKLAVSTTDHATVVVPTFSADSAYHFIEQQVQFGPRVPNSQAHKKCAQYLGNTLSRLGAEVTYQRTQLVAYDGTLLDAVNIIGSYKPECKKRVALFSHWDSRPYADHDPDKSKHRTPILGANDGASGVGALLEMARHFQQQSPTIGVDIIFLDAEDYGAPADYKKERKDTYWCLGSQYWARIPHKDRYNARFGILLDMVGGPNATFYKEYFSLQYAKKYTEKIWAAGKSLGYSKFFISEEGGAVTDDHVFINQIAEIPTVDIIPYQPNCKHSGFGAHWHTIKDDMSWIDKTTLQAVGQTVMHVVYHEK